MSWDIALCPLEGKITPSKGPLGRQDESKAFYAKHNVWDSWEVLPYLVVLKFLHGFFGSVIWAYKQAHLVCVLYHHSRWSWYLINTWKITRVSPTPAMWNKLFRGMESRPPSSLSEREVEGATCISVLPGFLSNSLNHHPCWVFSQPFSFHW